MADIDTGCGQQQLRQGAMTVCAFEKAESRVFFPRRET
jgi:hypothetical protein